MASLFPPPYFEWWNARETETGMIYDHLDASLAAIERHAAAHGPFDGYLGFSQGGSMAHLLCLLSMRDEAFARRIPPPRFGVFISARTTRHADHAELVANAVRTPLPLPSLVIYGGKDTAVPPEMTRELMTTLEGEATTEVFLPEHTHKIPRLTAGTKETVRAFLSAQLEAKANGATKA